MNKNCALKLVDEIILYYYARSKKHKKNTLYSLWFIHGTPLLTCNYTTFCSHIALYSFQNIVALHNHQFIHGRIYFITYGFLQIAVQKYYHIPVLIKACIQMVGFDLESVFCRRTDGRSISITSNLCIPGQGVGSTGLKCSLVV